MECNSKMQIFKSVKENVHYFRKQDTEFSSYVAVIAVQFCELQLVQNNF